LLTQTRTICQIKIAHGSDHIRRRTSFDHADGNGGMPFVMAVEVSQHGPDLIDGRINNGGA